MENDELKDEQNKDISSGTGPEAPAEPQEITLQAEEYQSLIQRLNELENLKETLLRSAADYENAKKRLAREREEYIKFSQENLIRSLLPVLDNFERALSHAESGTEEDGGTTKSRSLLSGVQMIHKQLLDVLKGQGLIRVESLNQPFDPHMHEALAYVPGEGEEDVVIEELEAGYMFHGRLLRAAKVRVRSAPASADGEQKIDS